MALSITNLFNTGVLNAYYKKARASKIEKGKNGEGLAQKLTKKTYKDSFTFEVYKDNKPFIPQIIQASNYDADIMIRGFETTTHFVGTKPFFREEMLLTEKDRQKFMEISQRNNEEEIKYFSAQLVEQFAGANGFLASVDALNTYMVGQFLSSGVITVDDNGAKSVIDFQVADNQKEKLTNTATWDKPDTAKPLSDLIRWKKQMSDKGHDVEIAVMSKKAYEQIKASKEFKDFIAQPHIGFLFPRQYKEIILEYTELKDIYIWDEKVLVGKDQKEVAVFSDKAVALIPDGLIGEIEYAPTPTDTDKKFGAITPGQDISKLEGSNATIEIATETRSAVIKNLAVVLSSVHIFKPTIIDKIFIATVVE